MLNLVDFDKQEEARAERARLGHDRIFSFDEHKEILEEEIEKARKEAFDEGYRLGVSDTNQEISKNVSDVLEAARPKIDEFSLEMRHHKAALEESVLEFVYETARLVLPEVLSAFSEERIKSVTEKYLTRFLGHQRIVVEVHSEVASNMEKVFGDYIQKDALEIKESLDLPSKSDVRIHWNNGFSEYRSKDLADNILNVLQKSMKGKKDE